MYSHCPHCQSQQTITAARLRKRHGILKCSKCGQLFDGLVGLAENVDDLFQKPVTPIPSTLLNINRRQTAVHRRLWSIATAIMLILLIGQLIYFEGPKLQSQHNYHAAIVNICAAMGCVAPMYKNLDELTVSHSELLTDAENNLLLTAAISNQSVFAQAYPQLKLVLQDFEGQHIAEQVFSAPDYTHETAIAANQTSPIEIAIVRPPATIGGFALEIFNP